MPSVSPRAATGRGAGVAQTWTIHVDAGEHRAAAADNGHPCHQPRHLRRAADSRGVARSCAELRTQGQRCSRKRVARLMRLAGVAGCHRRRFRTTRRDPARPSAPDLVQRTFSASTPNQMWVADLTYVPTQQGFLFLAVVLDACSRRVVGWSMAAHLRTELVVAALDMAALDMALQHRRPLVGVIHHSDHGSQYTSAAYQERCRQLGVRSSMALARYAMRLSEFTRAGHYVKELQLASLGRMR
jgi:transposase InsO family protein